MTDEGVKHFTAALTHAAETSIVLIKTLTKELNV